MVMVNEFDHENPWSMSCVWSKVKVTFDLQNSKVKVMVKFKPLCSYLRPGIQSICLLFVSWQSDQLSWDIGNSILDRWPHGKSKFYWSSKTFTGPHCFQHWSPHRGASYRIFFTGQEDRHNNGFHWSSTVFTGRGQRTGGFPDVWTQDLQILDSTGFNEVWFTFFCCHWCWWSTKLFGWSAIEITKTKYNIYCDNDCIYSCIIAWTQRSDDF